MARAQEMFERQDVSGSSSDEESLLRQEAPQGASRRVTVASVGLFCLAAACFAAVAIASQAPPSQLKSAAAPAAEPLTVRSLLEGHELAELYTNNVMAVSNGMLSPDSRDQVRATVGRKLANISGSIKEQDPEAYAQMGLLQLNEVQKQSVFNMIKKYSDPRMIAISNDMTDAVHETSLEGGDKQALKRRLAEKLAPRLNDINALAQELHPGHTPLLRIEIGDDAPVVAKYEKLRNKIMQPQMARRLATRAEDQDFSSSIVPQTLRRMATPRASAAAMTAW
uniref:Uncharacterized protein n=1 Tax=Strombidinopsis acuminata TaxID=141414 RepID=A0A7S3RMW3_9SPIT